MSSFSAAILAIAVTFALYLFYGAISRARARYAQILASRREAEESPEDPLARKLRHEKERELRLDAARTRLILEAHLDRGGSLRSEEGRRILREHAAAHGKFILFRGYAPERDAYLLSLALCEMDSARPLPRSPYEPARIPVR